MNRWLLLGFILGLLAGWYLARVRPFQPPPDTEPESELPPLKLVQYRATG